MSVQDIEKRIRAEVLAACVARFRQREPHFDAWAEPIRLLLELQPAAKDLEEHDEKIEYRQYNKDERTMRDTFERFSTRMELRLNPLLSLMDFLYAVYERGRRDAENIAYAQREELLREEYEKGWQAANKLAEYNPPT